VEGEVVELYKRRLTSIILKMFSLAEEGRRSEGDARGTGILSENFYFQWGGTEKPRLRKGGHLRVKKGKRD